jgi:hypothetical protein
MWLKSATFVNDERQYGERHEGCDGSNGNSQFRFPFVRACGHDSPAQILLRRAQYQSGQPSGLLLHAKALPISAKRKQSDGRRGIG